MMSTIYTMGGAAGDGGRVEPVAETRMEKVMRLKAAIEAGNYFVSSEDLSERIMASMLGDGSLRVQ